MRVKVKSVKSGGRFEFITALRWEGEEEARSGREGKSKWRSCCFAWTPASVREEPVTWKGDVRFREDFIVVSSVPATVCFVCFVCFGCVVARFRGCVLCECGHLKSFCYNNNNNNNNVSALYLSFY